MSFRCRKEEIQLQGDGEDGQDGEERRIERKPLQGMDLRCTVQWRLFANFGGTIGGCVEMWYPEGVTGSH